MSQHSIWCWKKNPSFLMILRFFFSFFGVLSKGGLTSESFPLGHFPKNPNTKSPNFFEGTTKVKNFLRGQIKFLVTQSWWTVISLILKRKWTIFKMPLRFSHLCSVSKSIQMEYLDRKIKKIFHNTYFTILQSYSTVS